MAGRLRGLLVLSVAAVVVCTSAAAPGGSGRFDRPRPGFSPPTTELRPAEPADVGMAAEPLDRAFERLRAWTGPTPDRQHPMYAGAVGLVAHDGRIVRHEASGYELRYADGTGRELPRGQWEPARRGTIFDIASLTKLFTSITALQEVERGNIRLDAPVADYLPAFAEHGKQDITVRQLMTHTSGLPAEVRLWTLPPEERIPAVLGIRPEHEPGTHYTYSDPNMITLGLLVERVSGRSLDEVVAERITGPLGMSDTGYRPAERLRHRIAATEYQRNPDRGMVRGRVHDENAWSLGGVAGHAGVFASARDLAVLGQALLNGGTYGGHRILSEAGVEGMLANENTEFPGSAHGLGFELDQRFYMGGLSGPRTAGHTGFTGTSLVLDRDSRTVAVLLSNRVHPTREWGSNSPARRALASGVAEALAVRPRHGADSWFARRDGVLRTAELGPVRGDVAVRFDAFVDTQQDPDGTDALRLEASADGRDWRPVPLRARGGGAPAGPTEQLAGAGHRSWWEVTGRVPAERGERVRLRWRYVTDESYFGRGVNLDGVRVRDRDRVLLDSPEELQPQGWIRTPR
ncbi:serine hydrolase domain-containing protein [Salinifilum ghardaiensis]